jgi:hypothetical protein
MDQDIKNLLAGISIATVNARELAILLARGLGGREVALTITKLEEAHMWAEAAQRLIDASKE